MRAARARLPPRMPILRAVPRTVPHTIRSTYRGPRLPRLCPHLTQQGTDGIPVPCCVRRDRGSSPRVAGAVAYHVPKGRAHDATGASRSRTSVSQRRPDLSVTWSSKEPSLAAAGARPSSCLLSSGVPPGPHPPTTPAGAKKVQRLQLKARVGRRPWLRKAQGRAGA
eukprot:scaffold103841_cov28-Phaeocystis_antarctica.AAC.1